ncbi:MAG: hypothetical protein JXA42_22085, partial [Anaerolineales bacterium]|nr:hypothetical protein [Anaerolineales bacterium]
DRRPGTVEYLLDLVPYEKILRPLKPLGMVLIPPGTLPPNPTEIINSKKMTDLITRLEQEFDILLIDAPPIVSLSDAKILTRMVEHVLYVFRYAQTDKRYVKEGISALNNSSTEIVGIILNGVDIHHNKNYYKYYHYYSQQAKPETESSILREHKQVS